MGTFDGAQNAFLETICCLKLLLTIYARDGAMLSSVDPVAVATKNRFELTLGVGVEIE